MDGCRCTPSAGQVENCSMGGVKWQTDCINDQHGYAKAIKMNERPAELAAHYERRQGVRKVQENCSAAHPRQLQVVVSRPIQGWHSRLQQCSLAHTAPLQGLIHCCAVWIWQEACATRSKTGSKTGQGGSGCRPLACRQWSSRQAASPVGGRCPTPASHHQAPHAAGSTGGIVPIIRDGQRAQGAA